jgi:hypothetical protein
LPIVDNPIDKDDGCFRQGKHVKSIRIVNYQQRQNSFYYDCKIVGLSKQSQRLESQFLENAEDLNIKGAKCAR